MEDGGTYSQDRWALKSAMRLPALSKTWQAVHCFQTLSTLNTLIYILILHTRVAYNIGSIHELRSRLLGLVHVGEIGLLLHKTWLPFLFHHGTPDWNLKQHVGQIHRNDYNFAVQLMWGWWQQGNLFKQSWFWWQAHSLEENLTTCHWLHVWFPATNFWWNLKCSGILLDIQDQLLSPGLTSSWFPSLCST